MTNGFQLGSSPHIKGSNTTRKIMLLVIAALVPSSIASIFFFGPYSGFLMLTGVISAMTAEAVAELLRKRGLKSLTDGSAALTGLLLSLNLPPSVPIWIPVVGSFVAILIGKMIFGGLGHNIFNPALIGRAFLVAAYPTIMTASWTAPVISKSTSSGFSADVLRSNLQITLTQEELDAVTAATPLGVMKDAKRILSNPASTDEQRAKAEGSVASLYKWDSLKNIFLGNTGGCIGETSALLLLLGGVFLCAMKIVNWRLPLTYILTVGVLAWILGGHKGFFTGNPVFAVITGGMMIGAFFMATDMVTSPMSNLGQAIFGLGAGILVVVIRSYGGYPEGVSYSILIMNAFTPLIDRYIKPKIFGTKEA
ncbi:RnfABCDGE type electron transport complex subunit D [candidate division WOR-3 bacterium]|nr:RnfABCDGE type electron transport complex subunit D [candidate division WOR-3 bacterium]